MFLRFSSFAAMSSSSLRLRSASLAASCSGVIAPSLRFVTVPWRLSCSFGLPADSDGILSV